MRSIKPRKSKKSSKPADVVPTNAATRWVVPALVAVVTCVTFLPALWNDFVDWDDADNFVTNTRYRGLGWAQLRWMFTTFHMGHYQPLSWVTLGLDYLIWGTQPLGYHLTSLILHVFNAVLFYFVVRRLLGIVFLPATAEKKWQIALCAGVSSFIFAIHPLRVESVVWATERRDVLSGLFFLTSIYCYLRACENAQNEYRSRWLSAAVISHGVSLLSKATAMTLPVVLLLLDVYPLRRLQGGLRNWFAPQSRHVLWEKTGFLVLSSAFAVIALFAQHDTGALRPMQQYFVWYRVAQGVYGICFYLWKSLLPIRLSPLYELPYDFDAWIPLFLFCGLVVMLISLILYLLRRRWPALLACWLYYLIVVGPVLGLVQSGDQLVADRYSYLSCLSWAVLAGGGLYCCWDRVSPRARHYVAFVALPAVTMIVLIWAYMTWKQTWVWRNSKTLWEHVVAVEPDSSIGNHNLGRSYESNGRIEQALDYYRRAVRINPTLADAHYNLARLLAKQDMPAEAIEHYRRVIMLKPGAADAHNNLGLLLALQGEVQASLKEFRKAVDADPHYVKAFFNMGRVLARQGDLETAVRNFQEAAKLAPNQVEILLELGDTLARQGKAEEAIIHFQDAIRLQPDLVEAHVAVARVLAAQGKKDEAERYYLQSLQILKSRKQTPQ